MRRLCASTLFAAAFILASSFNPTTATDPSNRTRYDNYPLFEIVPTTDEQVRQLRQLQTTISADDTHIFLQSGRSPAMPWLVVVAPHQLHEFRQQLLGAHIAHTIVLDDLQSAIDEEAIQTARTSEFGWTAYHTLDTIYAWLDEIAAEHPQHVEQFQLGTSYEGRPIRGVKIAFGSADDATRAAAEPTKPGVFIEGGIHAREWISPAFVTYLINELLTSTNTSVRQVAESHDWYIVPSVNPDGYVYTHEHNRLWRKTRSSQGLWCSGADANRNWDFHWNEHSTSPFPCSDIYPGAKPFSEVEMRDYELYLRGLAGKIHTFVAFHSYSQLLLYPYGHTSQAAKNRDDLQAIGKAAIDALAKRHGTRYQVGSVHETIYPASGSSADYVYEVLGVPLSYTYELRPSSGRRSFELPAKEIVPVGEETVDSLVAMLGKARTLGYNPIGEPLEGANSMPTML